MKIIHCTRCIIHLQPVLRTNDNVCKLETPNHLVQLKLPDLELDITFPPLAQLRRFLSTLAGYGNIEYPGGALDCEF